MTEYIRSNWTFKIHKIDVILEVSGLLLSRNYLYCVQSRARHPSLRKYDQTVRTYKKSRSRCRIETRRILNIILFSYLSSPLLRKYSSKYHHRLRTDGLTSSIQTWDTNGILFIQHNFSYVWLVRNGERTSMSYKNT